MAHAIASGYRSAHRLEDEAWSLIATYTMNHAMMALSIPYTIIADGGEYRFSRLPHGVSRHQKLRAMLPLLEETLADV